MPLNVARWIDHLPPWIAWGAMVSTGIYEPFELFFMSLPLLAAALVEWRRWGLGRWRRLFEVLALVLLLVFVAARIGFVPTIVHMLFLLCGIRLVLPREMSHRRQILLMAFLIWLTTAISTLEIDFLIWTLVWLPAASLVMLQQSWESSASLRRGPILTPPYFRVIRWSLATLCLGVVFFLMLPRLTLGLRAFPWGVSGLTASRAGLSDLVDLGGTGPIRPNGEVVLRVIPPPGLSPQQLDQRAGALELFRGIVLENADGLQWKSDNEVPIAFRSSAEDLRRRPGAFVFECFVAPSPEGIVAHPYGILGIEPVPGMPLRSAPDGSLRWLFPTRRSVSVSMVVDPAWPIPERPPRGHRLDKLTATGPDTVCAERWSRRMVPEELPPSALAQKLSLLLRQFRYTLDNPSGSAVNPLEDFLERSHAGHCEYFASALAMMLRHRGVPARVVNGYRLGPWIPQGGYWLVTQDEAHSWVEYFDKNLPGWRVADPTPAAPPNGLGKNTLLATLERWMDAVSYQWDRHVVRFSDADQVAGMEWLRDRASRIPDWRSHPGILWTGALIAVVVLVILGFMRSRSFRIHRQPVLPGGIPGLKPLLRVTQKTTPPGDGETARSWLMRLAIVRPDRQLRLLELAEETDAEAYGERPPGKAAHLAKEESRIWKRRST